MASDVNLSLGINFGAATKALKDFQGQFEKSVGSIKPTLVNVAAGFTAINQGISIVSRAVGSITSVFGGFIDAAKEQEDASNQLKSALIATGRSVDSILPSMESFASELQRTTRFGDETTLEVASLIQTLGNLDEQGLKKATKAAADFSVALGIDIRTAANLVGRAAAGNVELFSRYGVVVEKGANKAETFNNALKALEKFSGFAERSVLTFSGAQEQLGNVIGDVGEEIGNLFIKNQRLIGVINELKFIFLDLTKLIIDNSDELKQLISTGVVVLINTFKSLIAVGKALSSNIYEIVGAIAGLATAFLAVKIGAFAAQAFTLVGIITNLKRIQDLYNLSLVVFRANLLATGVGAIAVALGVFVAKLVEARKATNSLSEAFQVVFHNIRAFFTGEDYIDVEALRRQGSQTADLISEGLQEKLSEKKFKAELAAQIAPAVELDPQEKDRLKKEFADLMKGLATDAEKAKISARESLSKIEEFRAKGIISAEQFREAELKIRKNLNENLLALEKTRADKEIQVAKARIANVGKNIVTSFQQGDFSNQRFAEIGLGLAGAFAKGIEGAKSFVVESARAVGDLFFGAFGDVLASLIENLSAPAEEFVRKLTEGFEEFPKILGNILNNIPRLLLVVFKELPKSLANLIGEVVPDFIEQFISQIPFIIEAIIDAIPLLIESLILSIPRLIVAIVKGIVGLFANFFDISAKRFRINLENTLKFWNSGIIQGARRFVENIGKSSVSFFNNIISGATSFVKKIIEGAGNFIKELINKIGNFAKNVSPIGGSGSGPFGLPRPPIPFRFAEGGMVPGTGFSDTVPALLTPGEVVLNRDQVRELMSERAFGRDAPTNLTIVLKVSEQELARTLVSLDRKGFRVA